MKNKKLTYILIPLVIGVWGAIIYRIFNTIGGDGNTPIIAPSAMKIEQEEGFMIDTFALKLNYRDPFLGKTIAIRSENNTEFVKQINSSIPKSLTVTPSVIWPSITYGGLIKNKNSDKQFGFVQINGQVNIMKVGDVINEVTLTKILKDSIEVKFGKQKRFIAN